jgi:cysteinyl-tRNA synthetase
MLKIYNTLSRKKEQFKPRVEGKVGMYVCGMTVYDYCHVGHARVMVVFDTVARYFRYLGYDLTYVRNITDIDDKIIQRANDNGEVFGELTERFINAMHEDERALFVLPVDIEPRATQSIPDIIAMIETLIAKDLAYVGSNGDVFYAVTKFKTYGHLSGKNINDLQVGERVDVDLAKRNPLDFVLWKMAKAGEPAWYSPWGLGRPGWHIVQQCRLVAWAIILIFMVAVWIYSFPIMKMKSPSLKAQRVRNLLISGCTTVLCGLMKRKCLNRWVISLPCVKY